VASSYCLYRQCLPNRAAGGKKATRWIEQWWARLYLQLPLDLQLELILWLIIHSILLGRTWYDISIFFGYVTNILHQRCRKIWIVFRWCLGQRRIPELHEKSSLINYPCASRCGWVYGSSRCCGIICWKLRSIVYHNPSRRNCLALCSLSCNRWSRHICP